MENDLITLLIVVAVFMAVFALFSLTLYRAMNKVPEEKRYFPSWFVWMMLVPLAGFVFIWMMMPWGVPRTLKNGVAGNVEAEKRAGTLLGFGLAFSILATIPKLYDIPYIGNLFVVAFFVVWIIYWVKVAKFSKKYLPRKSDQQN